MYSYFVKKINMQFFHSYTQLVKCKFFQRRIWKKKTCTQQNFYAIVEFEDGLQLVPNNWLSADLKRCFWPNFTTNTRYGKAVKTFEELQPTWPYHPIRKIYATYCKYFLMYIYYYVVYYCVIFLIT